jgi:hypothetical protein
MSNRSGKYDAIVSEALRMGEPVARALRRAGFSTGQIRSCHGMLASIKARLVPEDDETWRLRKRLCYLTRRRAALERLEKGTSKSEAGDLQLVEAFDRALASLKNSAPAQKSETAQHREAEEGSLEAMLKDHARIANDRRNRRRPVYTDPSGESGDTSAQG